MYRLKPLYSPEPTLQASYRATESTIQASSRLYFRGDFKSIVGNTKPLKPNPPSPHTITRKGGFKASPPLKEKFGEGFLVYFATFKTSSNKESNSYEEVPFR